MRKLLLVLVTILLGISGYSVLDMEAAPAAFENKQVVVSAGDNLWGIAGRFAGEEEDIREVIDRIARTNRLDLQKAIQPGQTLWVPVKVQPGEKAALAVR